MAAADNEAILQVAAQLSSVITVAVGGTTLTSAEHVNLRSPGSSSALTVYAEDTRRVAATHVPAKQDKNVSSEPYSQSATNLPPLPSLPHPSLHLTGLT